MNQSGSQTENLSNSYFFLTAVLLIYGLGVAGYFVLRYNGQWTEWDTALVTHTIDVIRDEATLHPKGLAYTHGYSYQVISLAILSVAGLSTQTLQAWIYPFVAMIGLGLTALAFFGQLGRSRLAAILATFLLFLQPDVLFVTLRGSHEKIDWPLIMLALMLLYQSVGQPGRRMVLYIGLFYLTVFALIATNVFFASTFLVAILLSLVLGTILHSIQKGKRSLPPTDLGRLMYTSTSCGLLIFVFLFYIYPRASLDLYELRNAIDRISVLILSYEIQGQPYKNIFYGWLSQRVYLSLTAFTWLMIFVSFIEWLRRGKYLLERNFAMNLQENLDWLLYAGFAIQVGVSIVVDFSGVLGANMQLRIFPGFTLTAVCLLARGILNFFSLPNLRPQIHGVVLLLAGIMIAWFSLASVFKSSNEPLVSNKWTFYSPNEDAGLRWTDKHVRHANIWTGFDDRFVSLFLFKYAFDSSNDNYFSGFDIKPEDTYVFSTESDHLRGLRMNLAMPSVIDSNRIYDNGKAHLYSDRFPDSAQP